MAYTPQTWADGNSAYPVSAARMNNIESGVQRTAATADQALGLAQGAASGFPGTVFIDSFAGSTDDEKFAAMLSYAAAQSYKPTMLLGAGPRTFNGTYDMFDGFRLMGAILGEREFSTTGRGTTVTTSGTSFLSVPSAGAKNGYIHGIQFRSGRSSSTWLTDVTDLASGPLLQDFTFTDLAWVGYKHVMFARHLRCAIERTYVNAGNDTQFKLGGSDNYYWTSGPSYLSSTLLPANAYFLWFPHMSQSLVGDIYITTEKATGLRIDGSYGGLMFRGTKFDSTLRNATTACQGAQVLITGGTGMVFDKCWYFNGMVNPSATGRNDRGQVHISGGNNMLFDGNQWSGDRGNWANYTPDGTPALYASSNASNILVNSPMGPGANADRVLVQQSSGIITCSDPTWNLSVG